MDRALDYAAQLLEELCGAEIYSGVAKDIRVVLEPKSVYVTLEKINKLLGTSLVKEELEDIFNHLQYSYEKMKDGYQIILPSRRMDLEPALQDIAEDVARMYGYENIPTTLSSTRDKGDRKSVV